MKKRNYFILLFFLLLLSSSNTPEWTAPVNITRPEKTGIDTENAQSLMPLEWKKGEDSVALLHKGRVLWQYNFDKSEGKPYFHPLCTPDGTKLTWLRPEDHPWHRAVWFSWKYVNGLNYWEEDRETGQSEGITELRSVDYNLSEDYQATFHLELAYHPPEKNDLLREKRLITIAAPSENGSYYIDWETTFTAMADKVVLDRTPIPGEPNGKSWGGYAGFSARLDEHLQVNRIVNSLGETGELHGKASKWLTYEVKNVEGEPISLTIFDHPENLNHPNKWFIEKNPDIPFYYFSPAILFDSEEVLHGGEKLHLKYRLLISPGKRNQSQLQEHWNNFKK